MNLNSQFHLLTCFRHLNSTGGKHQQNRQTFSEKQTLTLNLYMFSLEVCSGSPKMEAYLKHSRTV